jgi:predicted Rossmann-fold nucleotide-binding protein
VQALHDHALDEALTGWLAGRSLVGVMGGHALVRGEAAYADAARLGALVGRTHTIATGGGPGAMEAANLGGRLAHQPEAALAEALDRLAATPSYRPSVDAWVATARSVTELGDSPSLGIPTWFYGHEPSNVFATAIAKYFRNALREAILLQICDAGIVFLPGAAGTVQEVFQDACENYYAAAESVAPMVLVGLSYWTSTVPVWPLLQSLARGRPMERHVHLVDTVDEAAELFAGGTSAPLHR